MFGSVQTYASKKKTSRAPSSEERIRETSVRIAHSASAASGAVHTTNSTYLFTSLHIHTHTYMYIHTSGALKQIYYLHKLNITNVNIFIHTLHAGRSPGFFTNLQKNCSDINAIIINKIQVWSLYYLPTGSNYISYSTHTIIKKYKKYVILFCNIDM